MFTKRCVIVQSNDVNLKVLVTKMFTLSNHWFKLKGVSHLNDLIIHNPKKWIIVITPKRISSYYIILHRSFYG